VACLSDNCVRRILADIATYLDNKSLHLSRAAFLTACGFRSLRELSVDSTFGDQVSYIQHQKCRGDLKRDSAKSVELQPSDRPGEVTIVTLKRFECIEVADLDEVGGLFLSSSSTITVSLSVQKLVAYRYLLIPYGFISSRSRSVFLAMLRIRDVHPGSELFPFQIRIKVF
jgi:hypothetical protein